ncbi:hypothetical protein F8M41_014153 [Gigaspora margarita]|uniref:Uncharacterized protein n=1 Tax=Gigaspora margarita TaxID=4874 RepID=A0A8H3WXG7_GIGMA|nr:hypothetical protein F8M41_014153 [Gigaspora margarita]
MFKFRSEEEVEKLNKKDRKHYQKSVSERYKRFETKRNQDLKYAKFKNIQTIVQYWRLANTNDFWKLVKQLHKTDKQIPKIDDPQIYDKFLHIINLILFKYKFTPQLYEKHSELIFSLIKLEKYYISISQQVPKKQKNIDKNNNNTLVPLKNLPKWMQQNYNKVIEKEFEIDIEKYNIFIENDNFVNIVKRILYQLTNACYDLYNLKNTNPIIVKYKKIEESIDNTTNKKQFIIELAEKFSLFSNKFDPINYSFKPKLLPYIKRFETCLSKIAKQSKIKRKNKFKSFRN